jgi:hypothetical protein
MHLQDPDYRRIGKGGGLIMRIVYENSGIVVSSRTSITVSAVSPSRKAFRLERRLSRFHFSVPCCFWHFVVSARLR